MEERDWEERRGWGRCRRVGKRREERGIEEEEEKGGGQVRGHMCESDKTSSFHFDWQARGGLSKAPTPTLPITLLSHYHTFSRPSLSLSLPPPLSYSPSSPSITCFPNTPSTFIKYFSLFHLRLWAFSVSLSAPLIAGILSGAGYFCVSRNHVALAVLFS